MDDDMMLATIATVAIGRSDEDEANVVFDIRFPAWTAIALHPADFAKILHGAADALRDEAEDLEREVAEGRAAAPVLTLHKGGRDDD